jgi:hypothetical protein
MVALIVLATVGACGGGASDPNQSALVGSWRASPAPGVQATGFIADSSFELVLQSDAHYSTALTIHYLDTSPVRSSCSQTEHAEGGDWSLSTIAGASVLALSGMQATTVERMGCKQATDNQARMADANGFKIGNGNVVYELSGNMLSLHFSNGQVNLQRE